MNADLHSGFAPAADPPGVGVGAAPDPVLTDIAGYAAARDAVSPAAREAAHLCLMDALAGGFLALRHPACIRLMGPLVPGATMTHGARVPGTSYELDPAMAAFNIGAMMGFGDPAATNPCSGTPEYCRPADLFGGILAVGDYLSRRAHNEAVKPPLLQDLLDALIKAHEVQSALALDPGVRGAGLDPVLLVRVACTAAVTALLGGSVGEIVNALSHALVDGTPLRVYRQAPDAGTRRAWAAGDAASRAVRLAFMAMAGEAGCPSALSAARWGFNDALLAGQPLCPPRLHGSRAMESVKSEPAPSGRFADAVCGHFPAAQAALIQERFADRPALLRMPVHKFAALLVKNG